MNRIEDFVEFVGGHIWDADVIAGHLEELGYFSAPASIRYHGNVTGGLYEHSIRWHMGAFDDRENWKYYSAAVKKYPNVLYTHVADMTASQIIGV